MDHKFARDFITSIDCLSAGIQRDKTMANKLMHIPNNDSQNYPFCRLQLAIKTLGLSKLMTQPIKIQLNC